MLQSLDPFYLEHASQIFQLVRASSLPPSLLCLSFADEEEEYLFKCKVRPLTSEERLFRADVMNRRLNSRCKGLLEAAPAPDIRRLFYSRENHIPEISYETEAHEYRAIEEPERSVAHHTVQYLHRTVKDYLESPSVWQMLLDACRSSFDPQMALLRSFVLQLKGLHPHRLTQDLFWANVQSCMSYAKVIGEQRPSSELVQLLDELDNAATELTSHPGTDGKSFTAFYGRKPNLNFF